VNTISGNIDNIGLWHEPQKLVHAETAPFGERQG
jgi:hypothetical protein